MAIILKTPKIPTGLGVSLFVMVSLFSLAYAAGRQGGLWEVPTETLTSGGGLSQSPGFVSSGNTIGQASPAGVGSSTGYQNVSGFTAVLGQTPSTVERWKEY